MCLCNKERRDVKERLLEEGKRRGYIRVYKTCYECFFDTQRLTGSSYGLKYKAGKRITSDPGWHVFLTREDAEWWSPSKYVKVCYAKPEWLLRVAAQDGHSRRIAATFHTLVFPKWDKGDMTIKEFRAACKRGKRND